MRRPDDESADHSEPDADRLSASPSNSRRAVHPYRDRREGLIARRRTLERELAEADRAASRRERIARHLAVIDEELADHRSPLVDAITIDTPCRARWEDMQGDDVVRRCHRCQRDVHDLSRMTREEIEALFARAAETPCVRLRRRRDGRVVTADCPIERPGAGLRALQVVAAGALFGGSAALAFTVTAAPHALRPSIPAPLELRVPPRPPAARVDVRALRSAEEEPPADDGYTMGDPGYVARAPAPITSADLDRHIRWIAPQAWEIDRALIDRVIAHPLSPSAIRALPAEDGVRVFGVRRGALLGRLGLQNGDTILEVNGVPLTSPDAALSAYARVAHRADALFVRIERRGEERVHVYRITE
jgi:hypothetical protein